MRGIIYALVSALFVVGCANYERLPSSQSVTYYDSEVVRDENGEIQRDAAGNPVVNLTNPREMTERALMLTIQQKAIEQCSATKGRELELLGDAIKGANTASGQQEWAEYMKQRDLITALKPDFDSSGCTVLVSAQTGYWNLVQEEIRLMASTQRMQYGLLNTVIKMAGIYFITDNIGDTLVGLASSGGSTYIGNQMTGNARDVAGGGATAGAVGEAGAAGPGGSGGGATGSGSINGNIDFGDAVIQLPEGGSLAGAGNAVLVGREGNYQETQGQSTGQQGQVITDPNSITNPSAGDGTVEGGTGGDIDFSPDQGQNIDGIL